MCEAIMINWLKNENGTDPNRKIPAAPITSLHIQSLLHVVITSLHIQSLLHVVTRTPIIVLHVAIQFFYIIFMFLNMV